MAADIRGKADWAGILRARREEGTPATVAGRDLRAAFDGVWKDLRRGRTADALAISRAAAILDPALFIREARRHGLFRSSKVAFHSEPVAHIIKKLLEDGPVLNWASDDALYLQSVRNLLELRNTLYHHSARLLPADGHDPMIRGLRDALETRGFLAAEAIKGKFNGKVIEIDLLAYAQGHLFIIEGKNAFHPCSAQEMRTSFDHIKKAGRQLTRAAKWLVSREVQARVFGSIGWKVRRRATSGPAS